MLSEKICHKTHIARSNLYEIFRLGKSIENKSRIIVIQDQGWAGKIRVTANRYRISY